MAKELIFWSRTGVIPRLGPASVSYTAAILSEYNREFSGTPRIEIDVSTVFLGALSKGITPEEHAECLRDYFSMWASRKTAKNRRIPDVVGNNLQGIILVNWGYPGFAIPSNLTPPKLTRVVLRGTSIGVISAIS